MTVSKILIAENVRRLRKSKRVSQLSVSQGSGIPQSQYSRIESGKVEPSLSTIDKIAEYFEVPVVELFREPSGFHFHDQQESINDQYVATLINFIDLTLKIKMEENPFLQVAASIPQKTFEAVSLPTLNFKFDREEVNSRK